MISLKHRDPGVVADVGTETGGDPQVVPVLASIRLGSTGKGGAESNEHLASVLTKGATQPKYRRPVRRS